MNEHLSAFMGYLTDKEKSKSTIESYTRYVKKFLKYVDGNEITKELVMQYRELLEREGSAYSTINLMLVSINCYLEYVQKSNCRVKLLKIQNLKLKYWKLEMDWQLQRKELKNSYSSSMIE